MTEPPPDDDDFHALTAQQAMTRCRAALKRLGELTVEEIDRDLARIDEVDQFEQLVLRARWMKEVDLWSAVQRSLKKYETPVGRYELVADVEGRLEWYKRRVAAEYERRVKADVELHRVTSPVEQIFLMEWHFARADEKCCARISPQKQVTLGGREVRIDFMVESRDGAKKLAIVLDGLDFHEETRRHAARERQLERSVVREGYTMFRFTGAEIVRDPKRCVEEIVSVFQPVERA